MKFSVTRTSCYNDKKPCEGAKKEKCLHVDERTVKSPKMLSRVMTEEDWYGTGKNHRVENGHIMRDMDTTAWFIELNTLEELLEFTKKHGQCIISESDWSVKDCPSIEIYDDYRE